MQQQFSYKGQSIPYTLTYKKVKNINLRIHPDKTIAISAPKRVSKAQIQDFLMLKADWILNCLENFDKKQQSVPKNAAEELPESTFREILDQIYPIFTDVCPEKPQLVIRTMKTRWGSCSPSKGRITMNRLLLRAPQDLIRYVMLHEFTHFRHADHSKRFYTALSRVCPDYKKQKKQLEAQNIL